MKNGIRTGMRKLDFTSSTGYARGDIAFALTGDPSAQCTANKYSVYEHNPKNPWLALALGAVGIARRRRQRAFARRASRAIDSI